MNIKQTKIYDKKKNNYTFNKLRHILKLPAPASVSSGRMNLSLFLGARSVKL